MAPRNPHAPAGPEGIPPARDKRAFRAFLDRLGYDYVDESANPAYRMFLGR